MRGEQPLQPGQSDPCEDRHQKRRTANSGEGRCCKLNLLGLDGQQLQRSLQDLLGFSRRGGMNDAPTEDTLLQCGR